MSNTKDKAVNWDRVAEQSRRRKIRQSRAGFSVRLFLGIFFISPVIVALVFSFVPNSLLDTLPTLKAVLNNLTFENYAWIFENVPILRYVSTSLIMCAIIIVTQVVIASLGAYAFSFFNFRGKKLLFNIILVAMMIPGQVTTIANFLLIQELNLLNSYLGLCLPYLIGGTAVFMMRQFYLTIPKELKEASQIDGCSDMRFLWKVAAPLSIPTIAALAIYLFIDVYNMYLWPMLVAQKQAFFTVQIGMSTLVAADVTQYGRVLAGAIISIIIPVAMFIIGQDYLIKGMTSGAVKG